MKLMKIFMAGLTSVVVFSEMCVAMESEDPCQESVHSTALVLYKPDTTLSLAGGVSAQRQTDINALTSLRSIYLALPVPLLSPGTMSTDWPRDNSAYDHPDLILSASSILEPKKENLESAQSSK